MTLAPVIVRELRAESRSAFTYWLRVTGAAALLVVAAAIHLEGGLTPQGGGRLFRAMHLTLFWAVWILVPVMTADCISRERREGTLGLLFLTPLRAFEVVLAKGLAHGLRAAAMCLATLPVLVVPFLLGGVGWQEVLLAVTVEFSAFCLALGAGLAGSACARSMGWSLVCAAALGCVLVPGLLVILGGGLFAWALAFIPNVRLSELRLSQIPEAGYFLVRHPDEFARGLSRATPGGEHWVLFGGCGTIALLAVLVLLALIGIAAWSVKSQVHERPRSAARERLEKLLCTPNIGAGLYRRWMRWLLARNPMGWLERRTWHGRLAVWSWLTVMIIIYSFSVPQRGFGGDDLDNLHTFIACLLVGNLTLSAAASLRRERESGVMELLLVTPLTTGQVISGRVRGLWGQFLPAAAVFVAIWLWMLGGFAHQRSHWETVAVEATRIACFAGTLLTLPVTGLYFSLRCRTFIAAAFWTGLVGVALPWLVAACAWELAPDYLAHNVRRYPAAALWLMVSIGTAAVLGVLLKRRLDRREFALPQ